MKNLLKFFSPLIALGLLLFLVSCKKEQPAQPGTLTFNIDYVVGTNNCEFDTVRYVNNSGNIFSVSRLAYYLHNFVLTNAEGGTFTVKDYFLIETENGENSTITISDIPAGTYTGVTFYHGIGPDLNIVGGLTATTDNNEMIWPTPLGGGYHFMKLEGRYKDHVDSTDTGFGMHLGKNANLVTISLNGLDVSLSEEDPATLNLTYDILEWHKNPNNWNFNTDGVAIMMNDASMLKLSQNGSDVIKAP